MRYSKVVSAGFINRLNRFIACVNLDGHEAVAHVKNTGRCKELLIPGCQVWLSVSDNPERKTKYDLIAVEKKRSGGSSLLINMDSQAPNDAVSEWLPHSGLFSAGAVIRREVTWHDSRFDFAVEDGARKAFLEVKGVTLENDGVACFPDAPTERGVKHLHELIACHEKGYDAYILFVIQMKEMHEFRPNDIMHPEFGNALRKAAASGVHILAMDCKVSADFIEIDQPVPVVL